MRALFAVETVLRNDRSGQARTWVQEFAAEREARRLRDAERLAVLRAGLRGVSPILERMCVHEGLSLAAVAYGVLPAAHAPLDGDGHPWLPSGSAEFQACVSASARSRLTDRWEASHYRAGGFVRPRSHPSGRWAVRSVGGVLQTDFTIGGVRFRSAGRSCSIWINQSLPLTLATGAVGLPVARFVEHPLLEERSFEITSIAEHPGGSVIRFRCAPRPVSFEELRPEPGLEHQQLGRDGSLSGPAALEDIIARMAANRLVPRSFRPPYDWHHDFIDRTELINAMAPPWAERIEL